MSSFMLTAEQMLSVWLENQSEFCFSYDVSHSIFAETIFVKSGV